MTTSKIIIYIFLVVIVSASLVMFQKKIKQSEVCFGEHCFSVELAKTKISQAKGLMFRRELDESKGMLFVFKEDDFRSFWMKNTLIPLDIIFCNKNKEVVSISRNVQPCETEECESIKSKQKAQYVLELNANIADKINLKTGDKLNFNLDN